MTRPGSRVARAGHPDICTTAIMQINLSYQ